MEVILQTRTESPPLLKLDKNSCYFDVLKAKRQSRDDVRRLSDCLFLWHSFGNKDGPKFGEQIDFLTSFKAVK